MVLPDPVCQAETDKEFGIEWPGAIRNKTVMRCCPNGTGTIQIQINYIYT